MSKKVIGFAISVEGRAILEALSSLLGVNKGAVVEILLRRAADEQKIIVSFPDDKKKESS